MFLYSVLFPLRGQMQKLMLVPCPRREHLG